MSAAGASSVAGPTAGDAGRPAVRVAGGGMTFPVRGGGETVALQDIDLDIVQSEFVSLIGPSGCGKSTLLRIVGDLIAPTTGSVEVNGKPAHQARLDRDYGMVFQAPVLFDWRRSRPTCACRSRSWAPLAPNSGSGPRRSWTWSA